MYKIVVLGILIVNSQTDPISKNGRYGWQCRTDKDCGVDIRCEEGYCACAFLNSNQMMTYDKIQRSCARLVGSTCFFGDDNFQCVSNAHCDDETQICVCNTHDYSPMSFGECRLNYGLECGNGKPSCNPEKFFRCNIEQGRCTCVNDDEQIYIGESESCFARPFEQCELLEFGISPPCVKNAICVSRSEDLYFGICECVHGFEVSESSSCMPLHGSPCSATHGCHPGRHLQCSRISKFNEDLICMCEEGAIFNQTSDECVRIVSEIVTDKMELLETKIESSCPPNSIFDNDTCKCVENSQFDTTLRMCRMKAGHLCDETISNLCVRHAVCEDGVCQCTSNHKVTLKGECHLPFKAVCISNSSVTDFTACHEDSFLKCQNERCECSESEVFDGMSLRCVQLILSPCDSIHQKNCVDNSICVIVDETTTVCTCADGFEQKMDGSCENSSFFHLPSKSLGILCYVELQYVVLNCVIFFELYFSI